ncbi:MAG: beta-galactosidase, partial [Planctomycetes bacterium]|nr:beta-galactosidase [Planctomycetota bacterium]
DVIDSLNDITEGMYRATKLADRSRPVLDVSGYCHRISNTDIYDSHDYEQNPEAFAKNHQDLADNKPFLNIDDRIKSVAYNGQPYFVSEFGGTWWNADKAAEAKGAGNEESSSWGYGNRVKDIEEFYQRFDDLCTVLLQNKDMFGYCYTQLTDVFQEENGIYNFDRSAKFDMQRIKAVQTQVAAIEEGAGV